MGCDGVVIEVTFSFSAVCHGRLFVSRMVMLSNLDCLFQANNITDLYRFLAVKFL